MENFTVGDRFTTFAKAEKIQQFCTEIVEELKMHKKSTSHDIANYNNYLYLDIAIIILLAKETVYHSSAIAGTHNCKL